MPHNNFQSAQILQVNWPTLVAGAFLGLMLSYAAFSGDQQGRVNLLYLLIVFFFIPILGLAVSLASLIGKAGINFVGVLKNFSFVIDKSSPLIRRIGQLKVNKQWFFMQSQVAALAYSISGLIVFLGMLVATDVNFVWRSTILSAEQINSFLTLIASPWFFWETAQPQIELLKLTQDSRMRTNLSSVDVYARWWQFIFALQIFYALIPRIICYWLARSSLERLVNKDFESSLKIVKRENKTEPTSENFEAVVCEEIEESILITNWANIDVNLLGSLSQLNLAAENIMAAGPSATDAEQMIAERWQGEQIVLVKSWEPPLGELEDYLQNSQGYLMPLDWQQKKLVSPSKVHIDEWIRFAAQLKKWKVYLPREVMTQSNRPAEGDSDD